MATPINMPQVGQDIETAIVTEWKVKPGDTVHVGDVVALVESDKAVFEVEAFAAGTITDIVVEEGEEGKVFEAMAYIEEQGEGSGEKGGRRPEAGEREKKGDRRPEAEDREREGERKTENGERNLENTNRSTFHVPRSTARPFASPSARRLARQHGVDLSMLAGSGPNGRIIKKDILKAVELLAISEQPSADSRQPKAQSSASVVNANDQIIPFSKIRKTIADRMTRSATTIPHFYLYIDVDMTAALAWREAFNVTADVKISVNDLIIRAAAQALAKHPRLNAHVESDKLIIKKEINIGVAVSVADGLIVPVIAQADQKNIQDISLASKDITKQARSGIMKTASPGTFTISNLGMYGVSQFLPIINPPEAAILGVGAISKQLRPGPGNSFAARDMLKLTLACDHRAIDGAYAAEFLSSVGAFLEEFE